MKNFDDEEKDAKYLYLMLEVMTNGQEYTSKTEKSMNQKHLKSTEAA